MAFSSLSLRHEPQSDNILNMADVNEQDPHAWRRKISITFGFHSCIYFFLSLFRAQSQRCPQDHKDQWSKGIILWSWYESDSGLTSFDVSSLDYYFLQHPIINRVFCYSGSFSDISAEFEPDEKNTVPEIFSGRKVSGLEPCTKDFLLLF